MRAIFNAVLQLNFLFLLYIILILNQVNTKMYLDISRIEDEAVDLVDIYTSSSATNQT